MKQEGVPEWMRAMCVFLWQYSSMSENKVELIIIRLRVLFFKLSKHYFYFSTSLLLLIILLLLAFFCISILNIWCVFVTFSLPLTAWLTSYPYIYSCLSSDNPFLALFDLLNAGFYDFWICTQPIGDLMVCVLAFFTKQDWKDRREQEGLAREMVRISTVYVDYL